MAKDVVKSVEDDGKIREALDAPVEERVKTLPITPIDGRELLAWGIRPVPPRGQGRRDLPEMSRRG